MIYMMINLLDDYDDVLLLHEYDSLVVSAAFINIFEVKQ